MKKIVRRLMRRVTIWHLKYLLRKYDSFAESADMNADWDLVRYWDRQLSHITHVLALIEGYSNYESQATYAAGTDRRAISGSADY